MEVNAIREALNTRPFVPFRMWLADGRDLLIPHPDFVAIAASGRHMVFLDPTNDRMHVLEPLLIVSLEKVAPTSGTFPTPPAPPGGDANGPGTTVRP